MVLCLLSLGHIISCFLCPLFFSLSLILIQERDAYLPLAESASKMYFVITDLSKINNMYRFSLASFLRLFQRALQAKKVTGCHTDLAVLPFIISSKNVFSMFYLAKLFQIIFFMSHSIYNKNFNMPKSLSFPALAQRKMQLNATHPHKVNLW